MHTSELITAEIEGRFGFFPSYFAPALASREVLDLLWRQTQTAYLDSPLPAHFKERLCAYLSRVRSCAYCLICHSCGLRELGASGRKIFDMLEPQLSLGPSRAALLLGGGGPLAGWPAAGSLEEGRLVELAANAFLRDDGAADCIAELRRLLGRKDFEHLVLLLS